MREMRKVVSTPQRNRATFASDAQTPLKTADLKKSKIKLVCVSAHSHIPMEGSTMAIYAQFGTMVDKIRYALVEDVKRLDKFDDEAKWSLGNRSWVVVEGPEMNENITHLARIRADEGLSEIIAALMGKEWECPYCLTRYIERGENERCNNAVCHKKHTATEKRVRGAYA